jgi:hypothetical protein
MREAKDRICCCLLRCERQKRVVFLWAKSAYAWPEKLGGVSITKIVSQAASCYLMSHVELCSFLQTVRSLKYVDFYHVPRTDECSFNEERMNPAWVILGD